MEVTGEQGLWFSKRSNPGLRHSKIFERVKSDRISYIPELHLHEKIMEKTGVEPASSPMVIRSALTEVSLFYDTFQFLENLNRSNRQQETIARFTTQVYWVD